MPHDRPRIALIGIGCRFPGGAHGPDGAWRVLAEGVDPVREVPPERWNADAWHDPDPEAPGRCITREGAFLDDVARFDAARFGISPREALQMDPQQRLLLEIAWEGLEDAGIAPDRLGGSRTGVYVGMGMSDYARRSFIGPDAARIDAYAGTGTFSSVAAGRVAYTLGLQGPALAIHTACSSSLVAIHLAVEALRSGKVDLALAGGVNLLLAPEPSVYFSKLGALSADGRCRTFDAAAAGYGRGEGCGVLVLRRLDEAVGRGERVRAVVLGSAINQDGRSNGLTAPSGSAQRAVIEEALEDAGIEASGVGLIEAHGTGTPLGDPIEAAALAQVYGPGKGTCHLRSVKTAFGHTEAAAGVAGVIAAALALEHAQVPPHLHFETLNPRIDLDGTRLAIPTTLAPLRGPRRAAISAFGLAGTNAHLILEEAPPDEATPTILPGQPELLVISAQSARGLDLLRPQYAAALRAARLEDVAYSAAAGRALLSHRLAIVASDAGDAAAQLASGEGLVGQGNRLGPVVFAYTGQGSQWHSMGRELYASEPVFREAFDRVDALFRPHRGGQSLVEVLYDDDDQAVHHTSWTQPALFALEWALTELWAAWGLRPDAVIGHSIGEITAAAVAGVFDLPDAVALVAERARLMGELPEGGTMAAVRAGLEAARAALKDLPDVGIAGVNSPNETVISGASASVDAAVRRLSERGIDAVPLRVSHAFHSPLVEPMLDPFERVAARIRFHEAALPVYSNLTGRVAGPEIRTATYWREHVRRPVRFAQGVKSAVDDGYELFVEIGPHPVLSGMGGRTAPDSRWIPSMVRGGHGRVTMLEALAALVVRGHRPPLETVWRRDDQPFLVDLPLTPPEGERYWLEPVSTAPAGVPAWGVHWVEAESVRGAAQGRWWIEGDPDVVAVVASSLAEAGADARRGLPRHLERGDRVVFAVPGTDGAEAAWAAGPEALRALWTTVRRAGAVLWVVTRNAVAADRSDRPDPGAAMAWGLGRVLSLEDPDAFGGLVDLPAASVDTGLVARAFSSEDQVAVRDGLRVPRLGPREAPPHRPLAADGSWLVTGGFGALGSAVARWLADHGVKRLVLASRGGPSTPERQALVAELQASGADVHTEAVDLRERGAVVELVDRIPDLVGVIHCAGAVDPGTVEAQDARRFRTGLEAKVLGAEALHLATRALPLDAFVLFSSISATWGSARLGAYAAQNAWLDALAARRRAAGLPAVSLAWGPWAGGGMVDADDRRRLARMGIRSLAPSAALQALGQHLHDRGHRILADVDWATFAPLYAARRPRPLFAEVAPAIPTSAATSPASTAARIGDAKDRIASEVRRVLGLDPVAPLDPRAGFFDLGMDSLMAVQLHRRLVDGLGLDLPTTVAFDHPNLEALVRFVEGERGGSAPSAADRGALRSQAGPIAIVGWSARFPGAPDAEALGSLLYERRSAIGPGPDRAGGVPGGFLDDIEDFDPGFFGIGPSEADALDPQQRLLLEGAVQALEHGGIAIDKLDGAPVGVFVGIGRSAYWDRLRDPGAATWPWAGVGNEQSFAAGRIAYALGLHGPAIAVNTACSSSLVAVHLAVQALREGRCAMALAGGVNVLLSANDQAWLEGIGAISPTGACHAFDAAADGYVRSEGCGMIALEPLEFAIAAGRTVLGLIHGTAVGHGGAAGGLTVPNGPAQSEVIEAALDDAGVTPDAIGYLECHGTGTALGDPIEVGALRQVFRQRERPLVLGGAKATIGHAETAAGIAGLIAAAIVLQRGEAPASPRLKQPNPRLLLDWPVLLPDRRHAVRGLAGVSSFGISGTNAHVVLGPAPEVAPATHDTRASWPIVLSAHSEAALDAQVGALADDLPEATASLASVARTLASGRAARPWRRWVAASTWTELRAGLADPSTGARGQARDRRIGLVFAGSLPSRCALELAERLPAWRQAFDRIARHLDPRIETPVFELLRAPPDDPRAVEPAAFAAHLAMADVLRELGVRPAAVLGHEVGEWVAAVVAGIVDLPAAAAIVAARSRGAGPLRDALSSVALTAPRIPMVSGLDGAELGLRATDPGYWLAQAASSRGVAEARANLTAHVDLLVDCIPDPERDDAVDSVVLVSDPTEALRSVLDAVGQLWVRGAVARLEPLIDARAPLVALPSVAWQRSRHWVEEREPAVEAPPLFRLDLEPAGGESIPLSGDTAAELAASLLALDATDVDVAVPGALSAEGPVERAAAVGLVAVLGAERPDRAVRLVDPAAGRARWVPWTGPAASPSGTWVVTGARGALGRRVVRWLSDRGVSVIAASRGEAPELAALPGVRTVAADVGTEAGVAAVLAGPVDGVIHCAGVSARGLLDTVTEESLAPVLHGKVRGAALLAAALPASARLVLFGSAAAWLGLPGQGAYAAANAALDGIAARRPNTTCIAWGPWETGMAASAGIDWRALGVGPLSDARALDALARVLVTGPSRVAAIDLDADTFQRARGPLPLLARLAREAVPEVPPLVRELARLAPSARAPRLERLIAESAAEVLGHDVLVDGGFFEQGLDSLGAVELARRLGQALGLALPATLAFDHPTPAALAAELAIRAVPRPQPVGRDAPTLQARPRGPRDPVRPTPDDRSVAPTPSEGPRAGRGGEGQRPPEHVAARTSRSDLHARRRSDDDAGDPIAVVGLACRFPGADDPDALWRLIVSGGSAIREVPPERWDLDVWYDPDPSVAAKMYTRHGGFLDGIDRFDPELFGISPREATALDPQQRLLLETAWRALDDAALLDRADGSRTGVFVGIAERGWLRRFSGDRYYPDPWSGTGSESSFAAGRVAHALGLHGPAIALNTTCSSSLVALHLAAEAIRSGDCDMALAGGVHLVHDPESTVYLCQLGALSPTGRCHTFDAAADGYVRGEGCGLLVLKRLSDALADGDRVRAVLRGSALNHDGHASGLTVPSGPAQTAVIQAALEDAGLGPDDLGWLQAHGTGTPLGDPIELSAAARALVGRTAPLAVGTVKTAIGHCELAAGVAGAIAGILALERQTLPPHPLDTPNPELELSGWLLPSDPIPWTTDRPRRVGVSAFGLSGTNAHVILEEAPTERPGPVEPRLPMLVPAAAHSEAAFQALDLGTSPAAWSGLARRAGLPLRQALVATAEGPLHLETPVRAGRPPRVAFLFTGQGSQWAGMHRALAGQAAYDTALAEALAALAAAEPALEALPEVLDDETRLGRTEFTQPALFAVEVATAAWWRALGVEPTAVAGHSIGELAAAVVAGGLSLADGARLVAARGRLMGSLPPGASMFVAHAGEATLRAHLAEGVEVTGVNDPEETALAGPSEAVEASIAALEAAGIAVTRLNVSHAFHTAAMDPILDPFEAVAATVSWTRPDIALVSTLRGAAVTDEPADPRYWRDHARRAVRFADAMKALDALGCDAFVECGPHPILVRMGQRTLGPGDRLWLGTARRGHTDPVEALRSAGKLWESGAPLRFDALGPRSTAPLPPYPMQRRPLWPDGDRHRVPGSTWQIAWEPGEPRSAEGVSRWAVIGDGAVEKALRVELSASETLDGADGVVIVAARSAGDLAQRIDEARQICRRAADTGTRLWWVTRGHLRTDPDPDAEAMWAWVRAAFAEHPEIAGGLVDLEPAARSAAATAELLASVLGHREVALADGGQFLPRIRPLSLPGTAKIAGTWLLTGGLGALGLQVAAWLADQGATRLILTARTPLGDTGPRAEAVAALRERVEVEVAAADAADREAMAALFDRGPLAGVVHLAGVTDPQPALDADPARAAAVVHGKVDGAWVIHALTREHAVPNVVFFGSIAAAWGSRELASYGAANAWLGGLARARRATGWPALCIHWGPWGGGGMVDEERAARLERMGQKLLSPSAALRILGAALGSGATEVVAARVSWDRFLALAEASGPLARFDAVRPARATATPPVAPAVSAPVPVEERDPDWLERTITRHAAAVLRLEPGTALAPARQLMELGFDSLMATELNNALLAEGIDVPLGRLLGGPSIEEIVVMAEARMAPAKAPDGAAAEVPPLAAGPEAEPPLFWTHLAAIIVGAAVASAAWWALG